MSITSSLNGLEPCRRPAALSGLLMALVMLVAACSSDEDTAAGESESANGDNEIVTVGDTVQVQEWHASNDLRVLFVESRDLPIVNVQLTFAAGSARDGELPGTARLVANSLLSGAGGLDANELAEAFDRHGAEVSTGAARDMAWVSLRSLSDADQLHPVADTVADMLAEPAFPAEELDRHKSQARTSLAERNQSPGGIAGRLFWETVYGDHPYGSDPLGTDDSLAEIEVDDLRAFHERYYVAANGVLVIVGDLDRSGAEALAERIAGRLHAGEPAPTLPEPPRIDEDVTVRESFPSMQAHVLIGRAAAERGDENWPALHVANHVFGGGSFTSRLFREVREDRGLVYGVYSYFSPMDVAGPFRIGLQTRGDQEGEALEVIHGELEKMIADGPDEDEIRASVRNITGGFPLQIDSNASVANYLAMIGFYDLPLDYLDWLPATIGEVDARSAHAAWRDALADQPLVTVIVGGDRARGDANGE